MPPPHGRSYVADNSSMNEIEVKSVFDKLTYAGL